MLEYIVCFVVLTICIIKAIQSYTVSNEAPPGPKGYPFFGVISEVDFANIHNTLYKWTEQYGDVFQFRLLGSNFFCINSVDILRETFLHEPTASVSASRPPSFCGKYFYNNYTDIIFTSPSPSCDRRRKFVHRLLHVYGEGKAELEKNVLDNLTQFKKKLRETAPKNVNPFEIVDEFILSTTEVLFIGESFGRKGPLQPLLKVAVDAGNRVANPGMDFLYFIIPFLRFLPFQMSRDFHLSKRVTQELLDTLEELSKETQHGVYHAMKEEKDENGEPLLTDDNMFGVVSNLNGAAYLTTRGTLLSAIHILAKRPELQRSLQKEIDDVIGQEREPRLSDRSKCPLTEAVVMETLRYISHVPVLVLHSTSQPTVIGGYKVEKDTVIVPNSWTMHHSEKYWDEPFSFKPKRFLDEDGQLLPPTHPVRKSFAAFGFGKRSCLGEVFAKSRIFLFLSSLMQMATIAEPDGKPLPDLDPRDMLPGIVLQPQEYEVRFLLR